MNSKKVQTAILMGAIALCLAMVPWSGLFRESKDEVKQQLRERFDQYAKLRLADDWVQLYEMTLPKHREKVDMRTFLNFHGNGYLLAKKIELVDLGFNQRLNTGATKMLARVELQPHKIPNINPDNFKHTPEDLIKESEIDIHWQRVGGEWYFAMEQEIVSGISGGQKIQPMLPKDSGAANGAALDGGEKKASVKKD